MPSDINSKLTNPNGHKPPEVGMLEMVLMPVLVVLSFFTGLWLGRRDGESRRNGNGKKR